jgi:hypothetical protein
MKKASGPVGVPPCVMKAEYVRVTPITQYAVIPTKRSRDTPRMTLFGRTCRPRMLKR